MLCYDASGCTYNAYLDSPIWKHVRPPTGSPHGKQVDTLGGLWCALVSVGSNSSEVAIGKATENEAWYGWHGQEVHCLNWFRHVGTLKRMKEPDHLPVCKQDGYGDLYFAVAKVAEGEIPAKATFSTDAALPSRCWYTYGGVEHIAESFEYLC